MEADYDVIIVGGGPSGLSAFNNLIDKDRDLRILLLEARDRVGGRTLTENILIEGKSYAIDTGGQWIGPTQFEALKLIKIFNLTLEEQYYPPTSPNSRLSDLPYFSLPKLSMDASKELDSFLKYIDELVSLMRDDGTFEDKKDGDYHDSISVQEMIEMKIVSLEARNDIKLTIQTTLSADTNDTSWMFFLFYCKAAGGLKELTDGLDAAQKWKIKNGALQISTCLYNEIITNCNSQSKVLFNQAVTTLNLSKDGGTQVVSRSSLDGTTSVYQCQKVILSLSPTLIASKISINPPLPPLYSKLWNSVQMGNVVKIILVFREPFWLKEKERSEENVFQSDYLAENIFLSSVGPYPSLVCLLTGRKAVEYSMMEKSKRENQIVSQLERMYKHKPDLLAYIDKDWIKEEFSGGCFAGIFSKSKEAVFANYGYLLREPIENKIYFASTEASLSWYGYIEGALLSGIRAANEVLEK